MIVLIEEDWEDEALGIDLECGEIINTDDENSPITANYALNLIAMKKATEDLDKYMLRSPEYVEGRIYSCNVCVVKDYAWYVLKKGIKSSATWVYSNVEGEPSEWKMIMRGTA